MFIRSKKTMQGRDIHEHHRAATPLELLFDLVFVVAIATAARELHHELAAHHISHGLIGFLLAFFAIWWAWINYSWFASAYDTDDILYRLLTMVQMFGALILAVGIPDVFRDNTQITVVVVGYAVMRLAMAAQWLRAGQDDVDRRQSCYRYAMGITLLQIVWIARLWMPAEWQVFILLPTMIAEMLVPVIAEYTGGTPWHPHHIAERYGLLIIIVLGEGILGATNAVANLLQAQGWSFDLLPLGLGITALVFAVWWLYFDMPWAAVLERERSLRTALLFGYSHYIVFAALAALGASLEVVADVVKHGHEGVIARSGVEETHVVSPLFAISTVAVALAIYLCSVAWMRAYVIERSHNIWMSLAAALLMLALAVGAVAFGLSLPWALLVTVTAPVVMTVICPNQATAEATP